MSGLKISATLACHNEAQFITAWLEETVSYANEILIAVHAPTDGTLDLISRFKRHSPIPVSCEWFPADTVERFGFSMMKNEMIARARGDWVTSIDADEEIGLSSSGIRAVIDSAMSAGCPAVMLRWATHPRPKETSAKTMADRRQLRLAHRAIEPVAGKRKIFCNHSGIWWRGIIHEMLYRGETNIAKLCWDSKALLHHYFYLRPKSQWKEPLYNYLLCRAYECPPLRVGTDSWWFDVAFSERDKAIRRDAQLYLRKRRRWFPNLPRPHLMIPSKAGM